jgi:hypothetical protein
MTNNNNNNNLPSTVAVTTVIPPGSDDRGDLGNGKQHHWTAEQNIALLEEVENCGAPIPAPKQTRKCWEKVLKALKSRGNTKKQLLYHSASFHGFEVQVCGRKGKEGSYSWRFWKIY